MFNAFRTDLICDLICQTDSDNGKCRKGFNPNEDQTVLKLLFCCISTSLLQNTGRGGADVHVLVCIYLHLCIYMFIWLIVRPSFSFSFVSFVFSLWLLLFCFLVFAGLWLSWQLAPAFLLQNNRFIKFIMTADEFNTRRWTTQNLSDTKKGFRWFLEDTLTSKGETLTCGGRLSKSSPLWMQVSHPVTSCFGWFLQLAFILRQPIGQEISVTPLFWRSSEPCSPGLLRLFIQRVSVRDKEKSAQTCEGEWWESPALYCVSAFLPCFLLSDDSARLEVGSLSVDELLCALTCLCAEKNRQTSLGAEEADSVRIVPMVNRWSPPPTPSLQEAWMYDWSGGWKLWDFSWVTVGRECLVPQRWHMNCEETHHINYNNRMKYKNYQEELL